MKKITSVKNAVLLAVLIIIFGSCSKDSPIPQLVSLNVVNASVNVAAAQVNYFGSPIIYATYTGAVDTILRKETLPPHAVGDSTFGVRFINLSYNSNPVNITLSTSTTTNEFAGIAYKANSNFKNYVCQKATTGYTFQVRDAGTGALIASYSFTTSGTTIMPYFNNVTLALVGQIGATGTNAPKVIRVNNY
ncbi:MAG: DUF4397 domain-containing protein [Sphingobacteriia bacterium]|nr:DUF4397 domain-containing protein [Sphingobacteriia bacterium]